MTTGSLGAEVWRAQPEDGLRADLWPDSLRTFGTSQVWWPPGSSLILGRAQLPLKAAVTWPWLSWRCPGRLLPSLVFLALHQTTPSTHEGRKVALRKCFWTCCISGYKWKWKMRSVILSSVQLCPENKLQVWVNFHALGRTKGTDTWKVISFGSCSFPKLPSTPVASGGSQRRRCSSWLCDMKGCSPLDPLYFPFLLCYPSSAFVSIYRPKIDMNTSWVKLPSGYILSSLETSSFHSSKRRPWMSFFMRIAPLHASTSYYQTICFTG